MIREEKFEMSEDDEVMTQRAMTERATNFQYLILPLFVQLFLMEHLHDLENTSSEVLMDSFCDVKLRKIREELLFSSLLFLAAAFAAASRCFRSAEKVNCDLGVGKEGDRCFGHQ